MAHVIKNGGAFAAEFLEVTFFGIRYQEAEAKSYEARRFRFEEIDGVLLSHDARLSVHSRGDIIEIQTSPSNQTHQAAIAALIEGLQRAAGGKSPG